MIMQLKTLNETKYGGLFEIEFVAHERKVIVIIPETRK